VSRAHVLDTASGRKLDLEAPKPEQVAVEDIAAALSKVCRFGAQASTFYSVAQHAVLVHDLVVEAGHRELAATALHHDSAEAYVCDLPSPLKALLHAKGNHAYREAADRLDQAIAIALGHTPYDESSPSGAEIKLADLRALLIEAAELLPDRGEGIRAYLGAGRVAEIEDLMTAFPEPLAPAAAEDLFLRRHVEALAG
jgi:5'-deoxynucleotidase YfbR-like HD superfamily hydrolase